MAISETARDAARHERLTVTPRQYRLLVEGTLALIALVVLSGAAVRLTGSGLGCPDWPSCHGRVVPTFNTPIAIEYGNRVLSGLLGIPCIAAAILAFRLRPYRRDLVVPAIGLAVGVALEGVIGGFAVRLKLHWETVVAHYLLAMVLLVAAAVLVWRVRREPGAAPVEHPRRLVGAVRALVVYGGAIIVLGTLATAAGPHAGGDATGDVVHRLTAIGLTTMIKIHGHAADLLGFAAIATWIYARRAGGSPALRRVLTIACVLIAAQGALGLIQYHYHLPPEVVWGHASLAALLWVAFLFSWMSAGRPAA